ncbi:T9SS type A sorting domain-containing protein [Lacinutrix sp. MEBiC02595]
MKKITQVLTLSFALFTIGIQAQTFPLPYCEITNAGDVLVEEITTVNFGEATIVNTDITSVLLDETGTIVTVNPDGIYTLEVSGNTYDMNGNAFDNDIVAFIDWNQNDVLDDAGEIYNIGTITGSTGNDGVSVMLNITVPTNANLGNTRIRITKVYQDPDSPAVVNPCAIEFYPFGFGPYASYGQALDFMLEVEVAPVFPLPYCEITNGDGVLVEEITTVSLNGSTINNTDISSVLIDETGTIVAVNQDEIYTLEVSGNTYDMNGNAFDNDIVAFIDWNQNDVLDDTGEVYNIGTITGSTGSDGVSVTMDIPIPLDAEEGRTRIRITKTYQDGDSPAVVNPCAIEFYPFGFGPYAGYGQALDFTIEVAPALSIDTFDMEALSVFPIPAKDILNIKYKSVLNAVKIYNLLGQEVYAENTASSNLKLDISTLSAGVYIVKLLAEKGQHNIRIIKQ